MSRITAINPETATGNAKTLLDGVKGKLGIVPNLMRTMAHSPAVLDAYLQFSGKLSAGVLPAKTRELISLTVGQDNSCNYCVAAHSAIGKNLGLTAEQIHSAREASSNDPKIAALLQFSKKVVDLRGLVSDADVEAVRQAGVTDAELAEVIANVSLNIFTNYFNHIAGTVIDFPAVEPLTPSHR